MADAMSFDTPEDLAKFGEASMTLTPCTHGHRANVYVGRRCRRAVGVPARR